MEKTVTWYSWEKTNYMNKKGTQCSRKELITKTASYGECLKELIEKDIQKPGMNITFVKHFFTQRYQRKMYQQCILSLKIGQVLLLQDFAKNISLTLQDEIKSNFWARKQVTLHTTVIYYIDMDGELNKLVVFHISELKTHDALLVYHITKDCMEIMSEIMPNVKWDKYYLWSDGCAAQYKGRSSFFYLQNLPVYSERHFFGAEHGKNESDSETGVISKQLQVAIKSRSVVLKSAADMHSYLCDKNEDKERVFKLVEQSHMNSIPKELKNPKLRTLSDKCTRLLHTIKPGANRGVFLTRNYSCFCDYCLKYEFKKCENKDFIGGKFEAHTLPIEKTYANKIIE